MSALDNDTAQVIARAALVMDLAGLRELHISLWDVVDETDMTPAWHRAVQAVEHAIRLVDSA